MVGQRFFLCRPIKIFVGPISRYNISADTKTSADKSVRQDFLSADNVCRQSADRRNRLIEKAAKVNIDLSDDGDMSKASHG